MFSLLNEFNCDGLRTHQIAVRKIRLRGNFLIGCSKAFTKLVSARNTPRAVRTQPAKNHFAFAKHSLSERSRPRLRNAVPFHVLNVAAAVADEVVMPHASGIEARSPALGGHFTHQSRLDQIAQIVISCCPRRSRIGPIDGLKNFCRRRMPLGFHQKRHDSIALRSAPQTTAL